MIAGAMLPIAIVENQAFKDYIELLDPSFTMPTRRTVKDSILPKLKNLVQSKVKVILKSVPWINTSVDLLTYDTVRPFNGYIAQGISDNWELITLPIEFDSMNGKRNFISFIYNDRFSKIKINTCSCTCIHKFYYFQSFVIIQSYI